MLAGSRVGRHVTQRMAPVLVVLYVLAMIPTALTGPWDTVIDVVFIVLSIVLVWTMSNLFRRRPPFATPVHLGPAELGLFVLVPPLLWVLRQPPELGQAFDEEHLALLFVLVAGLLLQLAVLVIAWALVYFGVLSLAAWLIREVVGSLGAIGVTLARTVPLLLGVVTFFFFTAEVWQSVGRVPTVAYCGVMALFVGVGSLFLASRWQFDLTRLARFETRQDLQAALERGMAPDELTAQGVRVPADCPLSRAQRSNLRLVATLSKLVVAALVGALVYLFFLCLGVLGMSAETVKAWTQADPRILQQVTVLSHTFSLSWEHLKVAGFLAVFTGFYFAVVSATDAKLREGLRETAQDAVREACAARLALLAGQTDTPAADGEGPAPR